MPSNHPESRGEFKSLMRCTEGAGMMVMNRNRRGSDRTQGDDFTHNDSLSVAGVGQRGFGVPLHP